MKLPKKNNIDKSILQKLRKKDVYETEIHKIYNLIVGQINNKLQEKAASDANFRWLSQADTQWGIGLT